MEKNSIICTYSLLEDLDDEYCGCEVRECIKLMTKIIEHNKSYVEVLEDYYDAYFEFVNTKYELSNMGLSLYLTSNEEEKKKYSGEIIHIENRLEVINNTLGKKYNKIITETLKEYDNIATEHDEKKRDEVSENIEKYIESLEYHIERDIETEREGPY